MILRRGVSQLFGLYCSTFWENVRSKNWMKGPRQNAQIKVPRPTRPPSAQRRDQHRRDDPRQLHRQRRRVAEVGVNGVIERRDDVPDADAVDEGAKADVLAPEPEFQQCFFSPIIRLLWAGDKLFMERYNDIRRIRLTPLISPQSVLSPAPPRSR